MNIAGTTTSFLENDNQSAVLNNNERNINYIEGIADVVATFLVLFQHDDLAMGSGYGSDRMPVVTYVRTCH